MRKAADELHVSQPSISAQIRLLEESFGQKLFRRGGRNLVLNEMGQVAASAPCAPHKVVRAHTS